jgi:hypothetical protein
MKAQFGPIPSHWQAFVNHYQDKQYFSSDQITARYYYHMTAQNANTLVTREM